MGKNKRIRLGNLANIINADHRKYNDGDADMGIVLIKFTKIVDEEEKETKITMKDLHDSAVTLSLGVPASAASENKYVTDSYSDSSSGVSSSSGFTTSTTLSFVSTIPSLDSGYQSELLQLQGDTPVEDKETVANGSGHHELGQLEKLYGNTEIIRLGPVSISAECINQRSYKATFSFEIPAKCMNGITHAAFKMILDAKVNNKFNTPYFVAIKHQAIYSAASNILLGSLEEEPGFTANCHRHECWLGSPTKIMFAMTSSLQNIAIKVKNNGKDKRKINEMKNRLKKFQFVCLRLQLTLRRRNVINPAATVENCDDLTHLYEPAHLTVESDPFRRT